MVYLLLCFLPINVSQLHKRSAQLTERYVFSHSFSGGIESNDMLMRCLLMERANHNPAAGLTSIGNSLLSQVPQTIQELATDIIVFKADAIYGINECHIVKGTFHDPLYDCNKIMDEYPPFLTGKVL